MNPLIEELFKQLVWKCFENKLSCTISNEGIIFINSIDDNFTKVSSGHLVHYEWETPKEVLERMNEEVNDYIKRRVNNEKETKEKAIY